MICDNFYFSLSNFHYPSLKKTFSILFVVVLLLNVMGYYVVFLGMQYRNDLTIARVLDTDQYNDSQTITLKIPVSIPYMTDQVEFQRVEGEFEHHGKAYRLVKQKYAKDTLTVVCFRDHENERITEALSNYVKTFGDNGPDSGDNLKITVSFIKEFLPHSFSVLTLTTGWQTDVIKNGIVDHLTSSFIASVVHPPERA